MKSYRIILSLTGILLIVTACKTSSGSNTSNLTLNSYFNALNNKDFTTLSSVLSDDIVQIEVADTILKNREDFHVIFQWDSVFNANFVLISWEQISEDSLRITYSKTCKRIRYLHDSAIVTNQLVLLENNKIKELHSLDYPNFNVEKWSTRRDTLVNWVDKNHAELNGFIYDMTADGAEKYLQAIDLFKQSLP